MPHEDVLMVPDNLSPLPAPPSATRTATARALAAVHVGAQVVCTLEEYYTGVRLALQRYAMTQAAQGYPERLAHAMAEVQRLDAAQTQGWWPGAYRSRWERWYIWMGRGYAIRRLSLYYFRRAQQSAARLASVPEQRT